MSLNLFRKEQDARDEGQRADAEREAVNQRKTQQNARDEAERKMDDLVNEIHRHTRRADKAKGMRDETIDRLQHATRANLTLDTGDQERRRRPSDPPLLAAAFSPGATTR